MFLELSEPHERTASILKIVLLVMMAFTVVFFTSCGGDYPREGYFLWLAAMLLAVFSEQFSSAFVKGNAGA
jgi:hypothetical protein